MQLSDSEKLERWEIANKLEKIHPGELTRMAEDVATYTGGFVDRGSLKYSIILGFYNKWVDPIPIERLREIVARIEKRRSK